MPMPTLVTFIIYFVVLLAMGLYFCQPEESIEGYLLGKRGLGAWVTTPAPGALCDRITPSDGE
jgi:Na+/proline symporter